MVRLLNDSWLMKKAGSDKEYSCEVPCSVYKVLIEGGEICDPYYRENEYISTQVCDDDYDFYRIFEVSDKKISGGKNYLIFEGIDTLSDVYLNGVKIAQTDNMHRKWEFDVTGKLVAGENRLVVKCKSANRYIEKMDKKRHLWGVDSTMAGYTHLRKAHCMFGWDWGPMLPDMGIWRDVKLESFSEGRILDVYFSQKHYEGKVKLSCKVNTQELVECDKILTVYSPCGEVVGTVSLENGEGEIEIEKPELWWVNGFGGQPLYRCEVKLVYGEKTVDTNVQKIGLRTLGISRDKDEWGEEFCFIINGKKIFAMGGNYIPEDQIVTRCTKEKTWKLLDECKRANFNFIRVWGGGYYPDGYFYDWCDENGFIVWQDFMFACSAYLLTEEFRATVENEIRDNIIRLRNHASLGLWCGNNEIESAWEYWGLPEDKEARADYLVLFEKIIPELLCKYDEDKNTFYWPSSPSSGGGIKDSSSNHAGDMHYWDVWHNFKPIEAFREFYYRFCSEYGFESLPDIKTVREFADEKLGDYDLCSPVMQAHQKCTQGNEKVMYYLAQMVRYPYDFERLIYSSQLVQADCIRSNVEHMRRARGRCMGSAYWQINDSNPVISWSSIDYFGRWKGLHYYAKKFYAPCLLSLDDTDKSHPILSISNERLKAFDGVLKWTLRNNKAEVIGSGECEARVEPLSSKNVLELDVADINSDRISRREHYIEYSIFEDGECLSFGTSLFVRPKEFTFLEPEISFIARDFDDGIELDFCAKNYAKSVCLSLRDNDCVFSDNWFDIHGGERVKIFIRHEDMSVKMNAQEVSGQLEIMHN